LLDFIYKNYADRKPIQVAEYAATHYTATDGLDSANFAINKMNMLYQGVKMLYPRVKEINWYSVNNVERATRSDRRLNNFSLTENPKVLAAYRQMLSDPYFLSKVVNGPDAENESASKTLVSTLEGKKINASISGLSWIKTYDPYISKVTYKLNGKNLTTQVQYPFSFNINYSNLKLGTNKLEIIVFDSKGREAARKSVSFSSGNQNYVEVASNLAPISNKKLPVSLPKIETKKQDPSQIKEVGWAEMAGKTFKNSIVVTKDEKFYFSVNMITESYPDVKAYIDLNTMEYLIYKNASYISYGEMVNLFKENDTYDEYTMHTSKDVNKAINKVGPEWLMEPGFVDMNGKGYRAGLVVAKDYKIYLNSEMMFENYPQLKNSRDIESMDSKTYKNVLYLNRRELENYLGGYGIDLGYTMHNSSGPPRD
jgi:hypothetical protein